MVLRNQVIVRHGRNISIMLNPTAAVSLLIGFSLLAVPSMPKNAVPGGYSAERLAMSGAVMFLAALIRYIRELEPETSRGK